MTCLRILFVATGLGYGGTEKQLVGLAGALAARGHRVAVYTLSRDVPRRAALADAGVELIVDQKRARLDPAVLMRLRRHVRSWRPDVVQGMLYDGDFYSRLACIGEPAPVFNSERNAGYALNLRQKVSNALTRWRVTGVVANSHAGSRFVVRAFGYRPEQVHVVPNGLSLDDLDRTIAGCREDYRQLFFGDRTVRVACLVGAIKPHKDYLLALRTAHELTSRDERWRILLVGDQLPTTGAYKRSVMAAHGGMPHGDRVHFAGVRTDVVSIIHQSDVLFSTSLHEGCPNVVLEAMGAGTPVVSTDCSDIARTLPCAWQVVAQRSAAGLADAIEHALAERPAVAAAQREWVAAHATFAAAAESLEDLYVRAVDGRRRPGKRGA